MSIFHLCREENRDSGHLSESVWAGQLPEGKSFSVRRASLLKTKILVAAICVEFPGLYDVFLKWTFLPKTLFPKLIASSRQISRASL
jgi:hypothetical protein